jgi:hypothetical protein
MEKHFFESRYKIFLINSLQSSHSRVFGSVKPSLTSPVQNTFRVLLAKPVQLENVCRNTIFWLNWLLILFSERTIFTKPSWKNSNYIVPM